MEAFPDNEIFLGLLWGFMSTMSAAGMSNPWPQPGALAMMLARSGCTFDGRTKQWFLM